MTEKKYIIRYKFKDMKRWRHFKKIVDGNTFSIIDPNATDIAKMTLKEARKYIPKIKEIRKRVDGEEPTKIQIINTETNEIVSFEDLEEEISRFELMEID